MKVDLKVIRYKCKIDVSLIQRLNVLEDKIKNNMITEKVITETSRIYMVS